MLIIVYVVAWIVGVALLVDGAVWLSWPIRRIRWRRSVLKRVRVLTEAGAAKPVSRRRALWARGKGLICVMIGVVIVWQMPIECRSIRDHATGMTVSPAGMEATVEAVDRAIQPLLSAYPDTVTIGLLRGEETTCFSYARGSKTAEADSGNAIFEIGSITKVFTSVLLCSMAEAGEVNLSDPLRQHLPQEMSLPATEQREVNLEDVATHYSGLPRLPDNLIDWCDLVTLRSIRNPYSGYTHDDLVKGLSSVALAAPPGTRYEYSNLGAGLLGLALSTAAGMPYEDAVVERICIPLRMHDTRIRLSDAQSMRLLPGYGESVRCCGVVVTYRAQNWQMPWLEGAGALRSTANDMLLFLKASITPDDTPVGRALRKSQEPRYLVNGRLAVGLGWHITDCSKSKAVYWHNGMTGGYSAYIAFNREARAGVVVLSNSAAVVDGIGIKALQELMREAGTQPE